MGVHGELLNPRAFPECRDLARTTEKHIYRPAEFMPTLREPVAQAFREYEKTEERRQQASLA